MTKFSFDSKNTLPLNWANAMRFAMRFAMAWVLVMFASSSVASETKLAVIGCKDTGLNDLLLVRLSDAAGITVVERQELDAVFDEKAVQSLMGSNANRDRMMAIDGADFLVLLSSDDKSVQLVVADTRHGVTLERLRIPTTGQALEKTVAVLCDQVLAVVAEFDQGVRHVVAVSDFVSRDLTYEYSFLQSDYAEVLRTAFRQIPGVALVAVDEATAIATERGISGVDQKERLVPVFVEGEYRSTRDSKKGTTTVKINVLARDSSKILVNRKLAGIPLNQAGSGLMKLFKDELGTLARLDEGTNGIDLDGQYKLLTDRAAQFSAIGEFRRSAALREAALLLRPESDDQRIQLVREYSRRNRSPVEFGAWPEGAKRKKTDSFWMAIVHQTVGDWKRSLQHCEYLIRNRRLSREEATDLTYNAIRSITSVRAVNSKPLSECEVVKKQFLRHSFARIADLDTVAQMGRKRPTGSLDVYNFLFESALMRCDGNFYTTEDLDLIANLLINDLPESMWPSYNLNFFLKNAGAEVGKETDHSYYRFTAKDYDAFLKKLIASQRPLVQVYGRYGRLCHRRYGKNEKSKRLAAEAKAIVEQAKTVGFDQRKYSYFMGQLTDLSTRTSRDLQPKKPKPVGATKKKPQVKPTSRLAFDPIELSFDDVNSAEQTKESPSKKRYRSTAGWGGVTSYRPLTDGLDAFWAKGAVLFSREPGKVFPVLVDKGLKVEDVVYDGLHVWVAGGNKWGVSVLNTEGRELARIGKDDGLPPGDRFGMVVHPIGPGRLLASGSFGNEHRAWIAVLSFDGKAAKVDVIHEATKVRDFKSRKKHYNTDPEMTFSPDAMIEHVIPGEKPRRVIIILHRYNPVIIDPDSLKVWGYPVTEGNRQTFPRNEPPAEAFMSIDGVLFVAGSERNFRTYRLNEVTGLFTVERETSGWHSGNARQGSLARSGDWLYYAGNRNWRRMNLVTGEEELLLEDTRALPRSGSGRGWQIAFSSHYGLVASTKGRLFRLKVKQPEGQK